MARALVFVEATPQAAAACLDVHAIQLWRIPYAPAQGRAPLLDLLAAYLGIPAAEVRLDHNAKGKPRLQSASPRPGQTQRRADATLSFNWSHSGEFALIALARDLALGVDIERLGKKPRAQEIARRYFDPREADVLAALDSDAQARAFIGLWCAKEAVLKAVGEGLSFGLARLAFALHPDADWQLARIDPELGDAADWQLQAFEAAPGYRGALAWRGRARTIVALRPTHPGVA